MNTLILADFVRSRPCAADNDGLLLDFIPFRKNSVTETDAKEIRNALPAENLRFGFFDRPSLNQLLYLLSEDLINGAVIANIAEKDLRRVDLTFSVSYDSDIDRVRDILNSIASAHPLVLKDPAAAVVFTKQGDSALEFTVRAWAKNGDYWTVYFDINEAVKKAFDKMGIEIPYPQMDVHVKNDK